MTISEKTFEQARLAYDKVDPYVPQIAKKAAQTGVAYTPVCHFLMQEIAKRAATSITSTACSAVDYTEKLVTDAATTIGTAAVRTKVLVF